MGRPQFYILACGLEPKNQISGQKFNLCVIINAMGSPGFNFGHSSQSSNPVRTGALFNASADKHQANIADTENKIQRQILGCDEFSASDLRQDLTVSKARLAYARMAATEAWQQVGADLVSRRDENFINLSKA